MTTFASAGGAPAGFADRLRAAGVVPVAEVEDAGRAVALAQALEAGGLPIVEVTFRTEAAGEALRQIARDAPRVFLIAGTVTSTRQADIALDAGVKLLVAPGLNRAVVEHAERIGLPMMPGVCTPSEVEAALSLALDTSSDGVFGSWTGDSWVGLAGDSYGLGGTSGATLTVDGSFLFNSWQGAVSGNHTVAALKVLYPTTQVWAWVGIQGTVSATITVAP